jgi:C1A family cysteine protease
MLTYFLAAVDSQNFTLNESFEAPEALDWREQSAVNEVQDQSKDSSCGSCYAFAAIAALESQYFVKTGKLLKLSEQEIVDCAAFGCNGGAMRLVYDYILKNGISTAEDYPYISKKGKCRRDEVKRSEVKIYGYGEFFGIEKIKKAVAQLGPVVASVYASPKHFEFYAEGIHNNPEVFEETSNHVVVIDGYGTDKETGLDYWIIRNSWSEDWGDDGYIKLLREKEFDDPVYFPLLDEKTKKSTTRFIQH